MRFIISVRYTDMSSYTIAINEPTNPVIFLGGHKVVIFKESIIKHFLTKDVKTILITIEKIP